jgi:hypothetical protein
MLFHHPVAVWLWNMFSACAIAVQGTLKKSSKLFGPFWAIRSSQSQVSFFKTKISPMARLLLKAKDNRVFADGRYMVEAQGSQAITKGQKKQRSSYYFLTHPTHNRRQKTERKLKLERLKNKHKRDYDNNPFPPTPSRTLGNVTSTVKKDF